MSLNNLLRVFLASLLFVATQAALATNEVVLTMIDPSGASRHYDLAALEALGGTTLQTHTQWTDGPQRFTGVLASVLLADLEAQGTTVRAQTLNDYTASMSVRDLMDYPVIIAYRRNGQYMSIREKGPLWIIFPLDDYPELKSLETDQKMAWHLRRLVVE